MFKVVATQCDQCLFSPNRIVSAARAKEILKDCAKKDTHFICHKTENACCRGFYNADPGASNLMRIAGRLVAVEFVDVGESSK